MKALQAVHPHEDSPPAGGLHHGAQLHEGFHHLLLGGVVVGRIRLQKSQGRAEGDGLGNQLPRANSCFGSSLRDLPEGSPGPLSRREEGHGSGIQLRSANQLQPKLEGGQPDTESLPTSGKGRGEQGEGKLPCSPPYPEGG